MHKEDIKVCLIELPSPWSTDPGIHVPMGMLYIAASLEANGVPVSIARLSKCDIQDSYDLPEADLYGITSTTLDLHALASVTKYIKHANPNSVVIVGGAVSLNPDLVDTTYIDSIVFGEGERVIFDILKDFPKVKPQYHAERIRDLDSLPHPARYLIKDFHGGRIFAGYKCKGNVGASVITSRGCPFRCAFCGSGGVWKHKITYRSVPNVMKEIHQLIDKYGVTKFIMYDDTVTIDRDRLSKLCGAIKECKIEWTAMSRVKPNDVSMFAMMYDAGCREVQLGIESADQNVLNALCKGTKVEDNRTAIINAHSVGLAVKMFFMVGTPGENANTVDRNIQFLDSLKDKYASVNLCNFFPLPGSDIYKNPRKYRCDILTRNYNGNHNLHMFSAGGINSWVPNIKNDLMTRDQQCSNIAKMREYVMNTGRLNLGR